MDQWGPILATVCGSAVFLELVRYGIDELKVRRRPRITAAQALIASSRINAALLHYCEVIGAHSVLIMESSNGEKLSRAGQVMLVTVTHEICLSAPEHAIQTSFIEQPVDAGYNKMLLSLLNASDGFHWTHNPDEIPSPMFRDMYKARKVQTAFQFRLQSPDCIIRYLSVRFIRPVSENDALVRDATHTCAREIISAMTGKGSL